MVKDIKRSASKRVEHFSHVRHMVKNDMSVIIAFSQLLEQELKGQAIDQATALSHIAKISNRAKKVVGEIDHVLSEDTATRLDD